MPAILDRPEQTYPDADHAGYLRDCCAELYLQSYGKEPPGWTRTPEGWVATGVQLVPTPVAEAPSVPMPVRRPPPSDATIVADFAAGLTHPSMARRYGISPGEIRVHLTRIGLWQPVDAIKKGAVLPRQYREMVVIAKVMERDGISFPDAAAIVDGWHAAMRNAR